MHFDGTINTGKPHYRHSVHRNVTVCLARSGLAHEKLREVAGEAYP